MAKGSQMNIDKSVFTTTYILESKFPIIYIVHDDDDEWQFLGGQQVEEKHLMIVSLKNILDYDKSIESILDLPKGFEAYREDIGDKWQITKSI